MKYAPPSIGLVFELSRVDRAKKIFEVFIHTALKELSKMFFLKIAPTPVFLHE
jgi:hypothetical protein